MSSKINQISKDDLKKSNLEKFMKELGNLLNSVNKKIDFEDFKKAITALSNKTILTQTDFDDYINDTIILKKIYANLLLNNIIFIGSGSKNHILNSIQIIDSYFIKNSREKIRLNQNIKKNLFAIIDKIDINTNPNIFSWKYTSIEGYFLFEELLKLTYEKLNFNVDNLPNFNKLILQNQTNINETIENIRENCDTKTILKNVTLNIISGDYKDIIVTICNIINTQEFKCEIDEIIDKIKAS